MRAARRSARGPLGLGVGRGVGVGFAPRVRGRARARGRVRTAGAERSVETMFAMPSGVRMPFSCTMYPG